eukprot:SAG31_NODE_32235_length_358_cov_0.814672_1_plen_48_part_10
MARSNGDLQVEQTFAQTHTALLFQIVDLPQNVAWVLLLALSVRGIEFG